MKPRILVLLLLLASCTAPLTPDRGSPFAPGPSGGQDADGLIVGHRLMAAGEYELALRAFYRAATQQGPTAEVLSAIGSADLKLGRLNQAEQVLRRAVEADQTFVPAWNNLGVTLFERGKTGEAAKIFETAYALDSGRSTLIGDNLKLAQSRMQRPMDVARDDQSFRLIRRGSVDYLLLTQP